MYDPKMMAAWFSLMAEATKGTAEAQEAVRAFSEISGKPDEVQQWLSRFMPGVTSTVPLQPEAFEEWMEESWRMMGMVPRNRYLNMLEKCDILQRKLDKAENTIQNLRTRLDTQGQQEENAQQILNVWGSMVENTLKTQTEWVQNWASSRQPSSPDTQDTETDETAPSD